MDFRKITNSAFFKKYIIRLERHNELLSMMSAILLVLFLGGDQSIQLQQRRTMVSEIEMAAFLTGLHTGLYKVDDKVLRAMSMVPREDFIALPYAPYAYSNAALPLKIGKHMIAEPFLTAMMVHLMDVDEGDRVLEIGFGTGYDTAILSQLAGHVYSVHQSDPMNAKLIRHFVPLEERGYGNVTTAKKNGLYGWAEHGPYDSILVRQSLPAPPPKLLEQLKPGGRLVMPLGTQHEQQRLTVFYKLEDGETFEKKTLYLSVTPLISGSEI